MPITCKHRFADSVGLRTVAMLAFCGAIVFPFAGQCQRDSLRHEILNYTTPNNELIIRGRKLISDKLREGDYTKLREVMTFLIDSAEDKDHIAFSPIEKWYICYLTGQYSQVLSDVRQFEIFLSNDERRVPTFDALFSEVTAKVKYDRLKIQQEINASSHSVMEKAFLVLNLDYLTEDERTGSQESVNDACNGFMALYPNSEFEPFIRKYLRYQYKFSNWAYSGELFTGYGVFTGDLSNKFTNPVHLGLSAELSYKKLILFLRIYGGFGLTRDAIMFPQGTWAKSAQTSVTVPEASLGYKVYTNRVVEVAPFAGISSIHIGPTTEDKKKYPEYQHVGFQTLSYSAGVNMDLKLPRSEYVGMFRVSSRQGYTFIRVRYAYIHQLPEQKNSMFTGNLHSLTIGIGLFGRRAVREY